MNYKKMKLLSWNCRGLGDLKKCKVVSDVIRSSRCDICMLQETKINEMSFKYVSSFLPSFFFLNCAYILARGSKGGMVIAWKKFYLLQNTWATRNTLSVLLRDQRTGEQALFTTVYGPSVDTDKPAFIEELNNLMHQVKDKWIIAGDFNLVRWMVDRTGNFQGFGLMDSFNDFITRAGLIDVQLKNRSYTWSSKRPMPSFSKLDRVLISPDWTTTYPVISLQALEMVVSDHVPLLLSCRKAATEPRRLKFEVFWLRYKMPKEMVQILWNNPVGDLPHHPLQSFYKNIELLQTALQMWHSEKFSDMENQLRCCKEMVLFFDRIEEHRHLNGYEFRLRGQSKERAFELANNLEEKWRQRSRCNWLKQGDKNTRFFHACASARVRKNLVLSIEHDGIQITDQEGIRNHFLQTFKKQLGVSKQVVHFMPEALYQPMQALIQLQDPFTENEVQRAVNMLAGNKASGPDGLPNEFLRTFWPELRGEIMEIMKSFYDNSLDLSQVNKANVVMIPKNESPVSVGDYRPISVINLIPKLISKVLANRLKEWMPDLISANQTAFIAGRQISDNFVVTREVLQHIKSKGKAAIFMKLDFAKAFDSIEWDFLYKVLEARGFPPRWIAWIKSLLNTATSRVIINGGVSEFFIHKRGLRQGDPLSPLLFNLAVDVFQQMVKVANGSIHGGITRKLRDSIMAYQYADDTAIIAAADITTLISLKLVIRLFASISGLRVNYQKSSCIPVNILETDTSWIMAVLGCSRTDFPIMYLGMPLTIKKPNKNHFLPLIDRIQSKLGGWKAKMISRGGRLQLVQSVLSTIPIYYMSCFRLPQWVINRIDLIRRAFLWGKPVGERKGISLTNWYAARIHKNYGGLGISDLKLVNISLLLKWWWKAYCDKNGLWGYTVRLLQRRGSIPNGPNVWLITGSFFWNQLGNIKHIFIRATQWMIGDGKSVSFWFDAWKEEPLKVGGRRGVSRINISLREAWASRDHLLPGLDMGHIISFSQQEDRLVWRGGISGNFTVKLAYTLLTSLGRIPWPFAFIWKCAAPPTVRVFTYLLLNNKILTKDILFKRKLISGPLELICVLCATGTCENAVHLFFLCPYAVEVWGRIALLLGRVIMVPAETVQLVWNKSWAYVQHSGGLNRKTWASFFMCTIWFIWKQRNRYVFDAERISAGLLAGRCAHEMMLWLKHC